MYSLPSPGSTSNPSPQPLANPAVQVINANDIPMVAPVPPQLRNVTASQDPRGTKRALEQHNVDEIESAVQPELKRVRTELPSVDPQIEVLFQAIEEGDVDRVDALFRQAPQLKTASNPAFFGATPLCFAAAHGQEQIADLLLSMTASVDTPDACGCTPLMYAAANGHVGIIHRLCVFKASVNAMTPDGSMGPLMFAVEYKQLEACKYLIQAGASLDQCYGQIDPDSGGLEITTPLLGAIGKDFAALIAFLLDAELLVPDFLVLHPHSWRQNPLVSVAAACAAIETVKLLLQRGANPYVSSTGRNGQKYNDLMTLSCSKKDYRLLECIAPFWAADKITVVINDPSRNHLIKDILNHIHLWNSEVSPVDDGLKSVEVRNNPKQILVRMAWMMTMENLVQVNRLPQIELGLSREWVRTGLLSGFLHFIERISLSNLQMLGKRAFQRPTDLTLGCLTEAQSLNVLIEALSSACCVHAPFSGLQLTTRTEQIMNRVFDFQSALLLPAIAQHRAQFDTEVLNLPDLCLDIYISRTNRWNEADLYRKLTEAFGLYDPVARAVLRLVKEAYAKLEKMNPVTMPSVFATLSPSEQLRHLIVEILNDWDKIPEIVEAIRQTGSDRAMEVISDLLFQQWRLFSEAFGVTKPRYSQFGPHLPAS